MKWNLFLKIIRKNTVIHYLQCIRYVLYCLYVIVLYDV